MGIFDVLKKQISKPRNYKTGRPCPPVHGNRQWKVYVYDPFPLSSVRTGDMILLDVLPYDITMTSTVTGWEDSSVNDGRKVALLYNGYPIGFMSGSYAKLLKAYTGMGLDVTVAATCTGTVPGYNPPVPEIPVLGLDDGECNERLRSLGK